MRGGGELFQDEEQHTQDRAGARALHRENTDTQAWRLLEGSVGGDAKGSLHSYPRALRRHGRVLRRPGWRGR